MQHVNKWICKSVFYYFSKRVSNVESSRRGVARPKWVPCGGEQLLTWPQCPQWNGWHVMWRGQLLTWPPPRILSELGATWKGQLLTWPPVSWVEWVPCGENSCSPDYQVLRVLGRSHRVAMVATWNSPLLVRFANWGPCPDVYCMELSWQTLLPQILTPVPFLTEAFWPM